MTNKDPTIDRIQQRAMTASAAVFDRLTADVEKVTGQRFKAGDSLDRILGEVEKVLFGSLKDLVDVLTDANLTGWLTGAHEVALKTKGRGSLSTKPPKRPSSALPPEPRFRWKGMKAWLPLVENAIDDLRARNLLTREQFDILSQEERQKAFTVAHVETTKGLADVREALAESVEEGTGYGEFREKVKDALGTSALGPGHMENVYRTGVASAYSAGLDDIAEHPLVVDEFPYERVDPIRDARLTSLCDTISKSGIGRTAIFRRDDPVFKEFRHPRHWS